MPAARPLVVAALVAVCAAPAAHAQSFPIAARGTEGRPFVVATGDPIVATYLGNSASYTNLLYLVRPGDPAGDLFLFNNQMSAVGSTVRLGSFTPGTELVFRLFVTNTGDHFFSGAAARNPDRMAHARVQSDWRPGVTLVSFEDLYGNPEGAAGFNDLSFSFQSTPSVVPEPGTWAMIAAGLGGVAAAAARRRRRARPDAAG